MNHMATTAQARKMLYDFMDEKRPWATHSGDVYQAMEEIVDYATFAFRGQIRPTQKDVDELNKYLRRFTEPLTEHPEDYEGPCFCAECRSDMSR